MHGDEQGMGHSGLDARMEAALRSYAEPGEMAEARVAVARILERARAEPEARRGWWSWRVAAAAACAVVLAIVVLGGKLRVERVPQIAWQPAAPAVLPDAGAQRVAALDRSAKSRQAVGSRPRRSQAQESSLPKLSIFPSPAPLTAAEQALVRFAATAPASARKQLVEAGKPWNEPIDNEPINIAELKIRPLDVGENHEAEGKAERKNP